MIPFPRSQIVRPGPWGAHMSPSELLPEDQGKALWTKEDGGSGRVGVGVMGCRSKGEAGTLACEASSGHGKLQPVVGTSVLGFV